MEPTLVETSTPETAPEVVTPTPEPPAAASIDAHAAVFSPDKPAPDDGEDGDGRARDDQGRFARHRAQSQRATAGDVGRIGSLTKKWRAEETARKELADKYAALEKEVQSLKAPKPPAEAPKPFEGKPPTWDQFANDPDPFAAMVLALQDYGLSKREAEQAAKSHTETTAAAQTDAQRREMETFQSHLQSHGQRVNAFKTTRPDFDQVMAKATDPIPPLLLRSIVEDDKSAEIVYALATRPDLLAEATLLSDGRDVTPQNVGVLRRLLASRVQVAPTGSTTPAPSTWTPPPPPNPVRTGPIKTADEPPGEGASIADHAKYYGPKRR